MKKYEYEAKIKPEVTRQCYLRDNICELAAD
jgi:hypothetical protein